MDWIWEYIAEVASPRCPIIFLQCWTKISGKNLNNQPNYLSVYYSLFTIDHTGIVNTVIKIQKKNHKLLIIRLEYLFRM